LVISLADRAAPGALSSEVRLHLGEAAVRELEEDEPEDGDRVLRRLEVGVRAELVSGLPEAGSDLVDVDF
jgi:hypothetical protein